ncbi:MAG: acyl-ACP thioesterase domain-containing protein [Syntrophobacteraceae bacterium]
MRRVETKERNIRMEAFYECLLKVQPQDTDSTGRLKVNCMFNYVQDMAVTHAERMGVGLGDVLKRGMSWVISWARLEFTSLPRLGDEFQGKTWPKCEQKLFSIRDFLFFDGRGDIFCRATTAWLLVDLQRKKAVSAHRLREDVPYRYAESALDCLPEKFRTREDAQPVNTRVVRYSDVDFNHHVNNARYVEFLTDCFDLEYHLRHQVKAMTVSFVSEAKYGDQIQFRMCNGTGKGSSYFVEGCDAGAGNPLIQASIEWTPREN